MSDLLRDAPVGQLIRWITGGKVLKYREEIPGFTCPSAYADAKSTASDASTPVTSPAPMPDIAEKLEAPATPGSNALYTAPTAADRDPFDRVGDRGSLHNQHTLSSIMSRPEMSKVNTRADLEQAYSAATQQQTVRREQSRPIAPEKTSDGIILVDWYTTDDQENPQNWSNKKKGVVVLQIYLYTLAVYMGYELQLPLNPAFTD